MRIRTMTIADHPALVQLLTDTPGVSLRDADSRPAITRYLERNPGMSFVAVSAGEVVGCVMSGHDGRRGYLHHLIVKPAYRRQGIGQQLVQACLDALKAEGILKTHLFVFADNDLGNAFWSQCGWKFREEIQMYSYINSTSENA